MGHEYRFRERAARETRRDSNIANQITEIAKSFEKWIVLRLDTISSLREAADVIGK